MGLEVEWDSSMDNPLLDIETESDQPAPPSLLTHSFHSHHTQSIYNHMHPMATTIHL